MHVNILHFYSFFHLFPLPYILKYIYFSQPINVMIYKATIFYDHDSRISRQFGEIQPNAPQRLRLNSKAPNMIAAIQPTGHRWQNHGLFLPLMCAVSLLVVDEARPCCPQCGATQLSFCRH